MCLLLQVVWDKTFGSSNETWQSVVKFFSSFRFDAVTEHLVFTFTRNGYVKVKLSISFSGLIIAAPPAKRCRWILCGRSSVCEQSLASRHCYWVIWHRRLRLEWDLKGLQETWVQHLRPPAPPSPSATLSALLHLTLVAFGFVIFVAVKVLWVGRSKALLQTEITL